MSIIGLLSRIGVLPSHPVRDLRPRRGGNGAAWRGLEALESRNLLAAVAWDGGGDGESWHDALNWSGNTLPGPDDDVTINVGGNPSIQFTATAGTVVIKSLTNNEGIFLSGGQLTVTNGWTQEGVSATFGGGTLTNTAITFSGGSLDVTDAGATLDNVTVNGDIRAQVAPASPVNIRNSLTLNGTAYLGSSSNSGVMNFNEGLATPSSLLGNAEILFSEDTNNRIVNFSTGTATAGTLTIGANVTIGGVNGSISNNETTGTIRNLGSISANDANGTIDVNRGAEGFFVNEGVLATFDGYLNIGGKWTNADGSISGSSGGFGFHGTFPTANLGLITGNAAINLNGTLDNTSATLNLASAGGTWFVHGGTIRNGTVNGAGGHKIEGSDITLDNVTVNGDIDVGLVSTGTLTVLNTLTLNGKMLVGTDPGTETGQVNFGDGSANPAGVLGTAEIVFGGNGNNGLLNTSTGTAAAGTLTIGANVLIRGHSGFINNAATSGTVRNLGTINADVITGTIVVNGGASGFFTNDGVVRGQVGTLRLDGKWDNNGTIGGAGDNVVFAGEFPTANIGTVTSGTEVLFTGVLNNTGGTLSLGSAGGDWTIADGEIQGGTVSGTGGFKLIIAGSGRLDGVTVNATVDVLGGGEPGFLSVRNNLVLNGRMNIGSADGSSSAFLFMGDESPVASTISGNAEIVFGANAGNTIVNLSSGTGNAGRLTIGQNVVIRGSLGTVENGSDSLSILNHGTIAADEPGSSIFVGGNLSSVTNGPTGVLRALRGTLTVSVGSPMINNGLIKAGAGGVVTIAGLLNNQATGTVEVEVGGTSETQFGRVNPGAGATLGGTLAISLVNGFVPAINDQFQIMNFETRTGTFNTVTGGAAPGVVLTPTYATTTLRLLAEAEPNNTPTDLALSNATLAENQPSGTSVGTFTSTDPDSGDTFTYTLVAGDGDDDNALFTIVNDSLQSVGPLNFESQGTYNIRVRTTDQGALLFEKTFVVTLQNVNEPPTGYNLNGSEVTENLPAGTIVGFLSTTDPDAGDSFTYTFEEGAGDGDNSLFQISGNQLQTAGPLDFEAGDTLNIRVRTTDADGLSFEDIILVTVLNAPDSPNDITLFLSTVNENQAVGTLVGTLFTADQDSSDFTYAFASGDGDDDNASFTINNGTIETGEVFDFETKSSYTVRVRVTDGDNLSFEKPLTITILDQVDNNPPTDIALSNATVSENEAGGTAVGTFTSTDSDEGAAFTYSLVSGEGGDDNGSFSIVGDELRTGESFDFETKATYTVRVRTTDNLDGTFEKLFTISVGDVDEANAPTNLNLSGDTLPENLAAGATVGTFSTVDPDSGETFTYTLVAGDGDDDNDSFTISGDTLLTSKPLDFETNPSLSIRVRTTDSDDLSFERVFVITATDVNDAPSAIFLSGLSVNTGDPIGTVVGTLIAADQDAGEEFTYELVGDNNDNAQFTLEGDTLKTAAVFNFTVRSSYRVTVRATDSGGLTFDKNFSIGVIGQFGDDEDTGKNVIIKTEDEDGTTATFTLTGGGEAAVTPGVDEEGNGFFDIVISNATANTSLTINTLRPGADGKIVLRNVTIGGTSQPVVSSGNGFNARGLSVSATGTAPIKKFFAKTARLIGTLDAPAGLKALTLDSADGATITIGQSDNPKDTLTLSLNLIENLSITSAMPIKSFTALEWIDSDETPDVLTAPSIGSITIKGSRPFQLAGDFEAGVVVTGPADPKKATLGAVRIAGSLTSAVWDVVGSVTSITVGKTVEAFTLETHGGGIKTTSLKRVNSAAYYIDGDAGAITALNWLAGDIKAKTAKSISIKGAKDVPGDFMAGVSLTGNPAAKTVLGTLTVANKWKDSSITVAGNSGSVTVGAAENSKLFVGVKDSVVGSPASVDDFDSFTLAGFTVKGVKGISNPFINTLVAAKTISRATLKDVLTDNAANADAPHGLIADVLKTYTRNITGAKAVRLSKIDDPTVLLPTPGEADRVDDYLVKVV